MNIIEQNRENWNINYDFGCEYNMGGMSETELLAMYHTLAKKCNSLFGTDFKYSESEITRCGNYKHKNFRFVIIKSQIRETYSFYSQDNDYGVGFDYRRYWVHYVPKETLIDFVSKVEEWLSANDIHNLTYLSYKKDWLFHIGIGIGITLDKYYEDCYTIDVDFSEDSLRLLRQRECKKILDLWSKNATTISEREDFYLKIANEQNRQVIFYIYNKPHCYRCVFDLDKVKDNKEIINTLKAHTNSDVVDSWVENGCSLFSNIVNNLYLAYDFAEYKAQFC